MDFTVARKLLQIRRERNLSQYAMARLLGLKRSTYAGYESGARLPGIDRLSEIARKLNVPASWFFEDAPVAGADEPAAWHQAVAQVLRSAGWSEERIRLAVRLIRAAEEEESDQ